MGAALRRPTTSVALAMALVPLVASLPPALADVSLQPQREAKSDAATAPTDRAMGAVNAVTFLPDGQHGWAVGGWGPFQGFILATVDGGRTWGTQATTPPLYGVSFVDQMHGWAVGARSAIFTTTDGGISWTEQTSIRMLQSPTCDGAGSLFSVSFVSPMVGWAAGGCADHDDLPGWGNGSGYILATTDGGAHWEEQPVPSEDLPFCSGQRWGTGPLFGVSFLDEQHGWAVGRTQFCGTGLILATSDGGRTWSQQNVNGGTGARLLRGVTAVDRSRAWAVGTDGPYGSAIVSTINGGVTWTPHREPPGVARSLNSVVFSDPLNGWAVGDVYDAARQIMMPAVLTTSTGGAVWTPASAPPGRAYMDPGNGVFSSLQTATARSVALASGRLWTGGSGNCGQATIAVSGTEPVDWSSQLVQQEGRVVNSIALVADKLWLGGKDCAEKGLVVASSPGGATWSTKSPPSNGASTILDVAFADESNGWAVGYTVTPSERNESGILFSTTDGGTTWTPQAVPVVTGRLSGLAVLDRTHVWAFGETPQVNALGTGSLIPRTGVEGVILATRDGRVWQRQELPHSVGALRSGVMLHEAAGFFRGWVVGQSTTGKGLILTTSDGGRTWTVQAAPAESTGLWDVTFTDSKHGWATGTASTRSPAGSDGLVVATSNGGETWEVQGLPTGTGELRGVTFVNRKRGWAVGVSNDLGRQGRIVYTRDAGATWTTGTAAAGPLNAVEFKNSTHGWAVGSSTHGLAAVLKTADGGVTWSSVGSP